jgi:hypothetical protein
MLTWLHSVMCSILAELGCPRLCSRNPAFVIYELAGIRTNAGE